MRLRPRGLSLRRRTAVAFALLALVLSVVMAATTFELSRRYLISKRQSVATRQALVDAEAVAVSLRGSHAVPALVSVEDGDVSFGALLRLRGTWHGIDAAAAPNELSPSLLRLAETGHVARQRTTYHGRTALFVAVPIPQSHALYVEIFSLTELERTLRTIAVVTIAGAIVTTLLGAAVGLLASRHVVRPLRAVAATAEKIANGEHDRRLPPTTDAEVAPLVASFNHMVSALDGLVRREARFASDVSHELRTPLTAMRAALDVLETRVDDSARPVLDVLRAQYMRFEKLVLDLLEVSRFDMAAQELVVEDVSPAMLVETVLRNRGHGDVPVKVDPSTPQRFELDKRRVERILDNLLANADLHGGGVVCVGMARTNGTLRISVDDAGPGVPSEERETVFERFHRGRNANLHGTGLGLALVAEHCRVHGGSVRVEDRPGGGARFVVELPEAQR